MNTGEDMQALRKIADLTRLLSVSVLALHFYLACYAVFAGMGLRSFPSDQVLRALADTPLFHSGLAAKAGSLVLLAVSLSAVKGRKEEGLGLKDALIWLGSGMAVFFVSSAIFYLTVSSGWLTGLYMVVTISAYLAIIRGGVMCSRILFDRFAADVFNTENETFPQEERLLENEYSVNLPAVYRLKGRMRKSWINIINPFRGILVAGTPGAGKSYFVIRHIIDQHLSKGFSMFVYDFKYDDLSRIAYNKLLRYQSAFKVRPAFYVINFDDLERSHRCNPLDPSAMTDITDATEASRTIMLGLNRDWIRKQGDFFVESPINFLTAIIWFLRKYRDGLFCTLPHVIELMQADYDPLFTVLERQEEIRVLINPFISAWQNKAREQLEGQVASAKIGLARLSSPQLYYVLSGNDFTLDVNNPEEPKVVCLGNNPQKLQIYGAVLSLYISRMIKLVNRKDQLKSSLVFDEFPTIYFNHMDSLIATARSNRVATTLAVQDYSQLKKDYGAEQAEVITGIVGNIISGQVTGDTARRLSELLGKINQERGSRSINSSDVSLTRSWQLDYAVPQSKIAALSSGEFAGMVADNPEEKINLKVFQSAVCNDHAAIAAEEGLYRPLPRIARVSEEDVQENYLRIKSDIESLLNTELRCLRSAPGVETGSGRNYKAGEVQLTAGISPGENRDHPGQETAVSF
ncbi:type IV secretory system conjugative DNA transfer family protein [Pedobacter sp. HMF7647]|uniref:Type IV secretory system conjugative DNA transfer family protein n=1 Tax=Hufsiella arboris TaxID=2695275 RepID=A0A7K1Y6T7_9SPHI|nr:conjugal transfer protein MobC [Hufsiella arboris]MXV50283.1 type IV secretory system conjugative DNA transfer family protein [Hufsiella arboris]